MNIFLNIAITLFITTSTLGQIGWYQQISGTGNSLFSVSFVDANTGWTVGGPAENGTILRTSNGGENWMPQINESGSGILLGVDFIDTSNGWIAGQSGKILRTTNGGLNWFSQNSGSNVDLNEIFFLDLNYGWSVGDFGRIQKTTDGGQNWISQLSGTTTSLYGVDFTDMNNGWAVGNWGSILKTTNGGQDWNLLSTGGAFRIYCDVKFINENIGWIVGDIGEIRKTTNGGQSWISHWIPQVEYFIGISCSDENNCWVVGSQGRIMRTSDGGQSWITQVGGVNPWLRGICFIDSFVGTSVGDDGTILRTTDGGVPVEFTSFTVSVLQNEKAVQLNWATATETNNSGFQVERRKTLEARSEEWENIGFVNGNGTTTEPQTYSFVDENLSAGKYQYRLKQIDFDGTFEYSNIIETEILTPAKFSLEQNYPNPFNPSTDIQYSLASRQFVSLKIFNSLGEEVETLVNEYQEAGIHSKLFILNSSTDGGLPSGVYYYQLKAGDIIQTKKMIILK
jgi:photosystem II stability/assembly factor-like uncharacterized protein